MSDRPDELLQRYADAVVQDERRPSDRVREAIRAHAQLQLAQSDTAHTAVGKVRPHAANQSKWTLSLVASVAMMALVGLLVVQIEHGAPEDREVAFGGPAPVKPQPAAAPDATPAPAVASVAAPAPKSAEATPPPPAMPRLAAKQAPIVADHRVAEAQTQRAVAGPAQPLAPPVIASREAGPEAAPAAPQVDAAQSLAKSGYNSADSLGNSPAPRDAKAMSRAEAPAVASARPMLAAPAPASVMAAPPPPPGIVAAPGGTMRKRADAATPVPLDVRFLAAVRAGRLDDIDALLAQGAPINARDALGNTALMVALGERQVPTARKLLERGADANLVNHEGVNALQIAVRMDLPEIVKLLQH